MTANQSFKQLLLALGFVFLGLSLSAQTPVIFIQNDTVGIGEDVTVNVQATGLGDPIGATFSLVWDTTQIELIDSMDIFGGGIYGDMQVDTGLLRVQYFDLGIMPLMLPDSGSLMSLTFSPVDGFMGTSTIRFSGPEDFDPNSQTDTVVSDNMGVKIPAIWIDGNITFQPGVSVRTFAEDARLTISPNPVTAYSRIELELDYSSKATLDVLDANGRLLNRQSLQVTAGNFTEVLEADRFPQAGTYLIRLTTDREQFTRKVIRR